jgi:hypothetical protein
VSNLILHKVLFLVVLYWNAACQRGSVIVKVCQLDTRSGSGNLERFFILLLFAHLWLFASLIEKCKVVLVFLLSSCIFCLSVGLFPLLWNGPWRRRVISFSLNLIHILNWNLGQPTGDTTLTEDLTSVLFLWWLNKVCLLAKKLVTLVSYTVFYNHWPCSSVFYSEHRVWSVIRPRCRGVLVTWRAHNWATCYSMWCSICCSRSVRSNF